MIILMMIMTLILAKAFCTSHVEQCLLFTSPTFDRSVGICTFLLCNIL